MVEIPILNNDDPEVRKESQIYAASARRDVMEELMMYYSFSWKLKVAVSWLPSYKRYLKNKMLRCRESSLTKQELEQRIGYLTLDELREAENEILDQFLYLGNRARAGSSSSNTYPSTRPNRAR